AIEGDPVQMRQLFQNLIGNALKFSKPEVPPVIEIRNVLGSFQGKDPGEESLINEYIRVIKVADNGIGFEEKYKERIFSVFQRLHGRNEYEGTGIGLAVCRKLVMRHGGDIKAKSIPGKGSTFIVRLPIVQPKEEKKEEA
ncbi:MAG: histidine kinase, partial [Candidatus Omnitrophica bacterium]|nr:histidine kinase [Candidatus Omnitrophota bacterium]